MTRGDNRTKILAGWRAQYAAFLAEHKDATAAGDKGRAAAIVRSMVGVEKAIRSYTEDRLGEHAKAPAKRVRVIAGGFDVTDSMPRTAARLDAMRKGE